MLACFIGQDTVNNSIYLTLLFPIQGQYMWLEVGVLQYDCIHMNSVSSPFFNPLTAKGEFNYIKKLLNPELSNEIKRCDHSNENSRPALSNGGVHIVAEQTS